MSGRWLASDKASYITGVTLRLDGGLILAGMPERFDGGDDESIDDMAGAMSIRRRMNDPAAG